MSSPVVAIQGQKASFHDVAARQFFGEGIDILCCDSFSQTFDALDEREADYSMVAIENTLFGSISETYDLLRKHDFSIIGEVYLRISQSLIGLPGAVLEDVREVRSHPVALAQCDEFLKKTLPSAIKVEEDDTAGSVALVKKIGDVAVAAIASEEAARLHDMEVLAQGIETHHQNYTRFIALGNQSQPIDNPNKTSLILSTRNEFGSLYRALGCFVRQSINMTKLESRPIIGEPFHELFYADFEAGLGSPEMTRALDKLSQQRCEVKVLGSYKNAMPEDI